MTGWSAALEQARQLQAEFPGWQVRPVRRRDGTGVEATRNGTAACILVGDGDEVRAALTDMSRPGN